MPCPSSNVTPVLESLDVFYGDLTAASACVYARLPRPDDEEGLTLSGFVRGPRCLHAETLPLSLPLVDLGLGPTVLARCKVPDPCCWSPDLPAIYDVTVHVLRDGEIIGTANRELGLRMLGASGRNLMFEGKRFVLRGISAASTVATRPRAWHETAAAYVSTSPTEEALTEASQWGSLCVVELRQSGDELVRRLRVLARFPGVAIAVIHGELPEAFARIAVAPNLLLAQPLSDRSQESISPWADIAWAGAEDVESFRRANEHTALPIIAVRALDQPLSIDDARGACDRLQRDLAPIGQFAGYVV